MKSLNYRVGIAAFFFFCFSANSFFAASLSAADFEDQVESVLREAREFKIEGAAAPDEIPLASNLSISVGWRATWNDLYVNGGVERQLLGQNLTIKLGFMPGDYDAYAQTYKAQPVVTILHHYSGGCTVLPYLEPGITQHFKWTNPAGALDVDATFDGKTVTVSDRANPASKAQATYSDLLDKWVKYAGAGNHFQYRDNKYYIVPQSTWQGDAFHFGYVISGGTPLYYTTGFPQGYVELYKESGDTTTYIPAAYSLATRLAFVLSPTQKKTWEVRQMTAEEIGEAMLDRSKKTSVSQDNSVAETSGVMIWKEHP